MIKRLKIKFVCINMLIVTVMLLVILFTVLHFTRANLERQSDRVLQMVMEDRVPRTPPWKSQEGVMLPYFQASVDNFGNVLAVSGGYYDLSDEESILEIVMKAAQSKENRGMMKEYDLRFRKSATPFGQKLVFVDISSERATMTNLVMTCLKIWVGSFALFFVVSVLLARWAVKPVEDAWNQQRQFVADASHELKTPLTVIMTNAELLQLPEYSPQQRSQFADNILTMSRQMRGLVEGLLELARVDNGGKNKTFSVCDLSELVCEGLLPFEPVYFEKGLQLESSVEEGIRVRGDLAQLRQVLDILLDNAAKYSEAGGMITVALQRSGGHCLLRVSNPGTPISSTDLQNIFKRFYRIDKARTMNHSYGLGLPIADSIVREHGGKIWAESSGGYNTFFVQLNVL